MKPAAFIFSGVESPSTPELALGQNLPAEVNGQPAKYYWKKMLPVGKFADSQNRPFEVTPQRIDTIIRDYKTALSRGYKAYLPSQHKADGAANFGWLLDVRKADDGSLEGLHQIIGEDGFKAVARNESSICTLANVKDEAGNTYEELLSHNAILPNPRIAGLGEFIEVEPAIAASRGHAIEAVLLQLAAPDTQESDMDLTQLREALGAGKEIPDAQLIAQAAAKVKDHAVVLSRATAAEGKVLELGPTVPATPPVDPEAMQDRLDLTLGRVDLAVARGDVPPFIADKLKAKLKDAGGKPVALMLSRQDELGGRPVDFILSLFDGAKLNPRTGGVTGAQALALALSNGAAAQKPANELLDIAKEMAGAK